MKTLLLTLSLTLLVSCHATKQSVVGTIVSIDQTLGKACDFGDILIQPAGSSLAGDLIKIELDDLDEAKASELNKYLNKKITLTVSKSANFCSKSTLEIKELN